LATKKKDPLKEITSVSSDFVEGLGLAAEVSVTKQESEEGPEYLVSIQGEDLGILIGYHGETLNALQLLLSLMVAEKLGEWVRIVLDAGGWREARAEVLRSMAAQAAERALASSEEVALPVMSSSDRRVVHLALAGNANVITESSGEEGYRRVVVKPKAGTTA
jgi:spoIIIJ-associated protein